MGNRGWYDDPSAQMVVSGFNSGMSLGESSMSHAIDRTANLGMDQARLAEAKRQALFSEAIRTNQEGRDAKMFNDVLYPSGVQGVKKDGLELGAYPQKLADDQNMRNLDFNLKTTDYNSAKTRNNFEQKTQDSTIDAANNKNAYNSGLFNGPQAEVVKSRDTTEFNNKTQRDKQVYELGEMERSGRAMDNIERFTSLPDRFAKSKADLEHLNQETARSKTLAETATFQLEQMKKRGAKIDPTLSDQIGYAQELMQLHYRSASDLSRNNGDPEEIKQHVAAAKLAEAKMTGFLEQIGIQQPTEPGPYRTGYNPDPSIAPVAKPNAWSGISDTMKDKVAPTKPAPDQNNRPGTGITPEGQSRIDANQSAIALSKVNESDPGKLQMMSQISSQYVSAGSDIPVKSGVIPAGKVAYFDSIIRQAANDPTNVRSLTDLLSQVIGPDRILFKEYYVAVLGQAERSSSPRQPATRPTR